MDQSSRFRKIINSRFYTSSIKAYKRWSENYDGETDNDNLMLTYDNLILKSLLSATDLRDKGILDYGCGTGRNWTELQKYNPVKIIGCDTSKEMLKKLNEKLPEADIHLVRNNKLLFLKNRSIDVLISTLVIAHIKDIRKIFCEWDRVLKKNSEIILTDFHPVLLEKGGERTFYYKNKTVKIRNYVHKIPEIESLLGEFGFKVNRKVEYKIDKEVKPFYENHNAVNIYNKFYGTYFIYGIHLTR